MKNFALIGAAGYIAPRHIQAIKDTGNRLVCAVDKSDSVGVLDRFFDEVDFFTEFERFDRYSEMRRQKEQGNEIHYVSICSPNYLHDAHIRFALRIGADAICEKPLVLNPWNLDALEELEERSTTKIYNILQLRVHPAIIELRDKVQKQNKNSKHIIDLTYITSRGKWYDYSWKGSIEKSGGLASNIGIHFFDMLIWIFGPLQQQKVFINDPRRMAGFLELENGIVRWFLSIDKNDLPIQAQNQSKSTFRSVLIDNREVEFSGGFTDLHTLVYKDILNGRGYGLSAARPSIELVHQIRNAQIETANSDEKHPLINI